MIRVTKAVEQVNWIEKGNMFLDKVLETVEVAHFTVQFAGFFLRSHLHVVVFQKVVAVVVAVLKEAVQLSFLSFSFGKHRGGGRRECWWMFLCSNTVSWKVVS